MKLERITIRNFRLLRRVSIDLTEKAITTVFVGPNNSGKTSVMDALRLFTSQPDDRKRKFSIHDIAHARRGDLKRAEKRMLASTDDEQRIRILHRLSPRIRMDLIFSYGADPADWVVANDLLMNLDPANNRVALRIEFAIDDAKKLLTGFQARRVKSDGLFEFLSESINDYYGLHFSKISEGGRQVEALENGKIVERLIRIDMVPAQRYMDDDESPRAAKLSKLLHEHYKRYYKIENADGFFSFVVL